VCAYCAQRAFLAECIGLVCDNTHIAEYVGSFAEFIELFCDAQGSFAKYVQGLFCEICTRALLRNMYKGSFAEYIAGYAGSLAEHFGFLAEH